MQLIERLFGPVDPLLAGILALIIIPLGTLFLVSKWAKSKGQHSIYKDSEDLGDIGMSLMGGLFNRSTVRTVDGTSVLRSTWGFILIVPIIVGTTILFAPWDTLWSSLGLQDPKIIKGIYIVTGLMLFYVWIWQGFFHTVTYDNTSISVVDDFFRTQRADLKDLIAVNSVEKRALTELVFKGGKKMKVVHTISHRQKFMADMLTRLEFNKTHPGQTPPSSMTAPQEVQQADQTVMRRGAAKPRARQPDPSRQIADLPDDIPRF